MRTYQGTGFALPTASLTGSQVSAVRQPRGVSTPLFFNFFQNRYEMQKGPLTNHLLRADPFEILQGRQMDAAENIKRENRLRTDPERGIMQADQNRREPMFTFNHFNFNVTDLDRSIAFYHDALGLKPVRRKEAADGSFVLAFLGDGKTEFQLELTWLRDHPQKYDLGECEFHLALAVENMEKAHALHEKLGCICYENPAMGIYFISDPDGYWIEIIPTK